MLDHKQLLIFTDLDGTLLGREDYDTSAALPSIQKLKQQGAEIILTSSKTLPELLLWQDRLGLDGPFVTENGGAAYFPKSVFDINDFNSEVIEEENYFMCPMGPGMETLRLALETLGSTPANLIDCTLEEAVELTGLNPEDAAMAQERRHTIPLILAKKTEGSALQKIADDAGLMLITGGRFSHLQGSFSKADAMKLVLEVLQSMKGQSLKTIALGDNHNDAEMLAGADVAVVVKCNGQHAITANNTRTIYTEKAAPEGWREGISRALEVLEEMK